MEQQILNPTGGTNVPQQEPPLILEPRDEPSRERVEVQVKVDEEYEARYRQQRINEARKTYNINIRPLNRGCVIEVGCQSIAFESMENATKELTEYLTGDTIAVQERWRKDLGLDL